VHTSPSKRRVLTLKRHGMEPILRPRAPNAPIVGGACSSHPGLSEHTQVLYSNSRPKPGVAWDSRKNGVLTLKRHGMEPILRPPAPNAPIVGGVCSSQCGLSEHTRVHCSKNKIWRQTSRNLMFWRQNIAFWRQKPLFAQSFCYASINLLAGYERSRLVLWALTQFCISNNKIWCHTWHMSDIPFT